MSLIAIFIGLLFYLDFESPTPFNDIYIFALLFAGALLEKKVEMDKRGMGVADYNGMVTKPLGCRPPPISKESSMDRPTFLDKVGTELWEYRCYYLQKKLNFN